MRPDEHKKKKTEAYKRKHGITRSSGSNSVKTNFTKSKDIDSAITGDIRKKVKNKQNEENEKSSGKNQQLARLKKKLETKSRDHTRFHDEIKVGLDSSSVSSDTEEDNLVLFNKDYDGDKGKENTYKKRQIWSNWQKYEVEPDVEGETVTTRGENFDKLVGMAGKALSHFRFKDELEWEHNTNIDDIKSVNNILNIDPAQLSQHLSCIPVHSLLEISPDIFTTSHMEEIIDEAKKNKHTLFPLSCGLGSTNLSHESKKFRMHVKDLPNLATDQLNVLDKPIENHVSNSSLLLNLQVSCSNEEQDNYNLSLKDEDLDLLICVGSNKINNATSIGRKDEDQSFDSQKIWNTKTPVLVSKEDENLEDWLNSILDD